MACAIEVVGPVARRLLFGVALLLIVLGAEQGQAASAPLDAEVLGRRAALVIGNANYASLPGLANPASDAARVGTILRKAGFEVTLAEDLGKAELEQAVRDFLRTLNDGDVALFYYSGHAVQVAGENFILPTDASLDSPYDLEVQSYRVSSLLDYMRAATGMQILILDACRDNPFLNNEFFLGDKKERAAKKGLATLAPRRGSLIVYSTAPDQVAYDGGGEMSPFAQAFTQNILSPNREVREVLTTIRNEVIGLTAGRQVPWDVSSLTSQFYFVSVQNVLALTESTTEIRVPADTREVRLRIDPPVASGTLSLTALFDRAPVSGQLLLDGRQLAAGEPVAVSRLGDVVYRSDGSGRSIELIPYTIRADSGQTAKGAVAIIFDPDTASAPDEPPLLVGGADEPAPAPITVAVAKDVGTGFAPVPALARGVEPGSGWLKVTQQEGAHLAVDRSLLVVGDVVRAEDLSRAAVRPELKASGRPAEIVLTPVSAAAKPVVIAVEPQINACDRLAAEPLDVQAVTDGVLPNDLRIAEALDACGKAVAEFPDVARFRFQLGRVLYADGRFDEAVAALRAAFDGGHARAGQFLGKLYQFGAGVERDPAAAVALFEKAAARGDPYGQYALGRALIAGSGVGADVRRGIELLTRSAESGHTYALNQLGAEYLYGNHVAKDVERAFVMFKQSAARGDVWGEVNLGLMYRDGVQVPRDVAKAYELFRSAHGKLHPYAGTLMAMIDRDGGKADDASVLALFRESARRGDSWGAFYAAQMVAKNPAYAQGEGEVLRLYALAAGQNGGKAAANARKELQGRAAGELAREVQRTLIRLGASGIDVDGRIGPKVREAAAGLLERQPPQAPAELLIALVRLEWLRTQPRLDMLSAGP